MQTGGLHFLAILIFLPLFNPLYVNGCVLNATGIVGDPVVFQISELEAVGTIVTNFSVFGSINQLKINSVLLTLVSLGDSAYGFNLTTALTYPRTNANFEVFYLNCEDTNGLVRKFEFVAQILDADNHPPKFQMNPYQYNMSESSAKENALLPWPNPKAEDFYDNNALQTITYAIVENIFNASYFRLLSNDTTFVTVIIQKALIFSVSPTYKVMIKAIDTEKATGLVKYEVNTTLIVNLINDQPPIFTASEYQATMLSNTVKNTPILMQPTRLKAYDADQIKNRSIIYSISRFPDIFSINQTSGDVYLLIDKPDSSTYYLTVTAALIDDMTKASSVTVTIIIQPSYTIMTPVKPTSAFFQVNYTDTIIVATTTIQTWPFIIMGIALALILVVVLICVILYMKGCFRSSNKSLMFGMDQSMYSYEDHGDTSLQKNPIEGYNNFVFDDDEQFYMYRSDSNISATSFPHTYVDNPSIFYDKNINNGSIETGSGVTSFASSQKKGVDNNNKSHVNNNNMEVYIADNAIYASSYANNTNAEKIDELTVYF